MKKLAVFLVGLILIAGCKSLTPVTTSAAIDSSLRPRTAQQKITSTALVFETLQWRGQAVLDRNKKHQKININTRLKHDEGIWINGSVIVPLARVFITPKQLQGYEKINRRYTQMDFQALKKLLGVPIDYEMLENLLTAKPLDSRAFKRAKLTFVKNAYVFNLRKRGVELKFVFDAEFRLKEQRLCEGKTTISILYDVYKKIDGQWIPEQLSATLLDEKGTTNLRLNIRQAQLNSKINMPFTIPKGYTSIIVE